MKVVSNLPPALRVAVDVQHAYKPTPDEGAVFTLRGARITEVQLAQSYAQAIVTELETSGEAVVLVNDPARHQLVGDYPVRHRQAHAWGARVYLACHVNAGGGNYPLIETRAEPQGRGWFHVPGSELEAVRLGTSIVQWLTASWSPALTAGQLRQLAPADRGWVCLAAVPPPTIPLLLEPFFGDNPAHLSMFGDPSGSLELGRVIARGVLAWHAGRS